MGVGVLCNEGGSDLVDRETSERMREVDHLVVYPNLQCPLAPFERLGGFTVPEPGGNPVWSVGVVLPGSLATLGYQDRNLPSREVQVPIPLGR
jgi:hypothetical protein